MNLSASFVRHLASYNEAIQARGTIWTEGLPPFQSVAIRNAGIMNKDELRQIVIDTPERMLTFCRP